MDVIATFDTVTGRRLGRLPASQWAWKQAVSASGSLDVTVPLSQDTAGMSLRKTTQPWRTIVACISPDGTVKHAGPIYKREWDGDSKQLSLSGGDFLDLLKRRIVASRALTGFTSESIPPDETGLPAKFRLSLSGSLPDLMTKLVQETLQFAPLPVVLPPLQGGSNQRNYLAADLATVEQRITDLSQVINGPEFRFEPRLADGGQRIEFHLLTGEPELVIAYHQWDGRLSRTPVKDVTIHEDASDMVGDAWNKAGEQADEVLLARAHDRWLENNGWPLLQVGDSSQSTISNLVTLEDYAKAEVQARDSTSETISFSARRIDEAGYLLADAATVGDHVYLRWSDEYTGDTTLGLKILELSGDESDWVQFGCRTIMENDDV